MHCYAFILLVLTQLTTALSMDSTEDSRDTSQHSRKLTSYPFTNLNDFHTYTGRMNRTGITDLYFIEEQTSYLTPARLSTILTMTPSATSLHFYAPRLEDTHLTAIPKTQPLKKISFSKGKMRSFTPLTHFPLEEFTLSNRTQNTVPVLQQLLSSKTLQKVSLERTSPFAITSPLASNIKHLRLAGSASVTNEFFKEFPESPHLEILDIRGCPITNKALARIVKKCPNLKTLYCNNSFSITPEVMNHLGSLAQLEALSLSGVHFPDHVDFDALVNPQSRLKTLHLDFTNITPDDLEVLSGLPLLEKLTLICCRNLQGQDLQVLGKFNNVKFLDLADYPLNTSLATGISAMKSLETLKISRTTLKVPDMNPIIKAPLKVLRIPHSKTVYDVTLKVIAKIHSLERLEIYGNKKFTNNGVKYLKDLPNLRCLNLTDCTGITENVGDILSQFPALEELNISRTNITDKTLAALSGCQHLHTLRIGGCEKITSQGLEQLQNFPCLRKLNLCGCRESVHKTLSTLKDCPHLKQIDGFHSFRENIPLERLLLHNGIQTAAW